MTGPVPALSVVMPVYNKAAYLDEAVGSILAQSFADFEFVILDDGSTDGSGGRLRAWAARDARIRLIDGAERSGPAASSNRVVETARAPLLARMDADDIAHPDRLERQVKLLRAEPDVVLVGALAHVIGPDGRRLRAPDYGRLLGQSPMPPYPHTTIAFRREAFDRIGGYRAEAARWEDVDLSLRMAATGRVRVIPRPLVDSRLSSASTRLGINDEMEAAMDAMLRAARSLDPWSGSRLLPAAFLPTASLLVWRGKRPRVLRRLLRHGDLRVDRETLHMLAWAMLAELSPRTLRAALRLRLNLRNRRALRSLRSMEAVDWRPPSQHRRPG